MAVHGDMTAPPGQQSGTRAPARRRAGLEQPAQPNRWWLVAGAGLVVFMAQLDASIVSVALPAIEADLGVRTSASAWVVLGYLLPVIALVLPSGRWVDGVGKRAALVFATAGFAVASVLAGMAPGIGWLVGARVAQGAFGAVLLALTPALATIAVRPEARGRAMGVVTTLGPLGAVSGPVLGGLLVDSVGWPWIFYVNVPVSAAVIVIAYRELGPDGRLRLPDRAWAAESVVLAVACSALFLGLTLAAGRGFGWLAVAAGAVPALAVWRRMAASRSIRRLLRLPGLTGPHVALLTCFAAMSFVQFLAPFYLQRVLAASAAVTGLVILAFPLAMAVFGILSGVLADHWGARRTAVGGTLVLAGGLLLFLPLGATWTIVDVVWRLAIVGVGVGLFNAPDMTMAMSSAPRDLLGTTAASTALARQLGLALGPAVATAAWALSGYTVGGMRVAIAVAIALGGAGVVALVLTPPAIRPDG